jgi:ribosomal protein L3 glutamine methyltransferase
LTLGELIRSTEKRFHAARLFYGHGTGNARDEAAFLVLRVLRLPFDVDLGKRTTAPQEKRIESMIRKRIAQRIPVPYLLNEAWLAGHAFYVDKRVIIPRSHIAELLGERLRPWLQRPVRRLLDLCTGSGCLAILAAKAFPGATIDASDVSPAALAVARRNVALHKSGKRVRLVRSDLFTALKGERYEVIVTNPPYVDATSMRRLPAEYRHEPQIALAAGRDGLDALRGILKAAHAHLAPKGLLVCEVGAGRRSVERAFPRLSFAWPEVGDPAGGVFVLTREELAAADFE